MGLFFFFFWHCLSCEVSSAARGTSPTQGDKRLHSTLPLKPTGQGRDEALLRFLLCDECVKNTLKHSGKMGGQRDEAGSS